MGLVIWSIRRILVYKFRRVRIRNKRVRCNIEV